MGYYLNLVNHDEKLICEACKCVKDQLNPYFDSESQLKLIPLFIEYCSDKNLKIDVVHDLECDELYWNGYQDFKEKSKQ